MDELIREIIAFRDERNWGPSHNPKDLALSLSLEASELLEIFQWKTSEQAIEDRMEDIRDELADVLIYALTFAHDLRIDVASAIAEKMKKNALKYPAERVQGASNR